MKTRSVSIRLNKTNQEGKETISALIHQFESEEKLTEEMAEMENGTLKILTLKKSVRSSLSKVTVQHKNQLHPVRKSESSTIMNIERNQSQQLLSPGFNIFVNASPTKINCLVASNTARPVIQQQLNGNDNSHDSEGMSSQEGIMTGIVPNDLSNMLSTDSRNKFFNFCDSSNNLKIINENNSISSNQNDISQENNSNTDVSDLSDVSSSEKSSECLMSNVTQNKEPAFEVVNEKERPSQKRAKKKSKAELDKDFVSVSPKLQNKLLSLIKKQIASVNTNTYKSVKSKVSRSKYKHLIKYHKNKWESIRKGSSLSGESEKGIELNGRDKSDVTSTDYTPEVIDLSDSDTPAEKGDNDGPVEKSYNDTPRKKSKKKKKVKSMEKVKKKRKVKSAKKHESSHEDGNKKHRVRNVALEKQEIVGAQKPKDRECKKLSDEKFSKWVKKIALTKASEIQPKLSAGNEKLDISQFLGTKHKNKVTKRNDIVFPCETLQNDILYPYETPRRPKTSYLKYKKRSPMKPSPDEENQKGGNEDQALASENVENEEICSQSQNQANENQVLASENVINEEICNSKEAQELESGLEPVLASGNSDDEKHQNDNQVSVETSENLSDASQLQPTICEEKEIVDKPVVNSTTSEDLRNKWLASLASYEKKVDSKQNKSEQNSVPCFETPKRFSSDHRPGKPLVVRFNGAKCSTKVPGSSKKEQANKVSMIRRNGEICPLAITPESLDLSDSKRCLTLLAEGCNFSEILQKFREKYYKEKVKVFFPERNRSKSSQVPPKPNNVVKELPLGGEKSRKRSLSGDVSNVQTVKRKKEKDKSDRFKNINKPDENINPSLSLKESVRGSASLTDQPLQEIEPSILSHEKEPHNETSPTRTPFIPMLNNMQSKKENNVNCDVSHVRVSEKHEKVSDGFNVKESRDNSSLTGIGTTPEKTVILQEDGRDTNGHIKDFKQIKKKLRLLPDNKLPRYSMKTNNVLQSPAAQLDTCSKVFLNKCMAQNTGDTRKLEKTDIKLKSKRKRSLNSSATKMKESNERDERSNKGKGSKKTAVTGDDYIPLNATGPTRFAVAPLDKVSSYREHAAKDFKGKMLYGDRVKRFNSAKSLDIYKLKQKASREKSSY